MPEAVLLVDDEPDVLETMGGVLEAQGLTVATATRGDEALRLLDGIDVIVCDYRMPGMDGVEVLRRARQHDPSIARILVTAYADVKVAIDAVNEAGVDGFLCKPFDGHELIANVQEALRRRPTRKAAR